MEDYYVLEITLISAQGLKDSTGPLRCMQTYAVAWIDPSVKLRSSIDRVGGENPTWNDKFLFRVSSDFLSSETSGVSVEIFADGVIRDTLLGTVRILVSNLHPSGPSFDALKIPSLNAVQVRRPSGRIQGVLNVGAIVLNGAEVPTLSGISAIGFRELMGQNVRVTRQRSLRKSNSAVRRLSSENENPFPDSDDQSEGCDSTTSSSSSSTTSRALKEWNEVAREMGRNHHVRSSSDGRIFLCGLVSSQRKASRLGTLMCSESLNERKVVNGRSGSS